MEFTKPSNWYWLVLALLLAQVFPLIMPIVYRNDYGITCDFLSQMEAKTYLRQMGGIF